MRDELRGRRVIEERSIFQMARCTEYIIPEDTTRNNGIAPKAFTAHQNVGRSPIAYNESYMVDCHGYPGRRIQIERCRPSLGLALVADVVREAQTNLTNNGGLFASGHGCKLHFTFLSLTQF